MRRHVLFLLVLLASCREASGGAPVPSEGTPPPPPAVDLRPRGRELFFGRAGCSACHSVAGEGGRIIGPDLGQVTDLDRTVRSILTPDAEIAPGYARGVMPALAAPGGPLDSDDVLSIAVYLTFRKDREAPDPRAVAGAQHRLAEARAVR